MQEKKPLQTNIQAKKKVKLKQYVVPSDKPKLSVYEQERLNNALIRAAMDKDISGTLRLIKAGADIAVKNDGALYWASMGGCNEICNILLDEYEKLDKDIRDLIAVKTSNDWTPLQVAARDGHTETCTLLSERYRKAGGDVKKLFEAKNNSSFTPLHHAANTGHTETCALLINEYEKAGGDVIKLITARNYGGETSIDRAIHQRHTETAQFLTIKLLEAEIKSLEAIIGKESTKEFMSNFRECTQ
ncbi:MAG: ankyrin repeat domain-containing protein [Candidatus Micrarchaeota archaeon]|nr:ankyrin repeat domain-containing protein [Candidatus Micrarchaeota archaeon]